VEVVSLGESKHSHRLSQSEKANKMNNITKATRTIILSSLTTSLGFLFLSSPSMADQEVLYANCAELQKVMNDYSQGKRYKGFEKVQMMRRNLTYGGKYILICNGGTIIDRGEGTICHGYIGYSYAPIVAGADYYASWGKSDGTPNTYDTGKGNYCRSIK
jgi:hypothetical protein